MKFPEIQTVPISKIKPYNANAKQHPQSQIDLLVKQISEGFDQPIVVDKDFVIIKGHGRRLAAMQMGLKNVPVIVRDDLTPTQVKAARIADNKLAETDWDDELLRQELEALEQFNYDLADLGFDESELETLLGELQGEEGEEGEEEAEEGDYLTDEDEVPEEAESRVKRGEIWQLGEHRLMCGDATSQDDVSKLMNGETADICFTSPPYALSKSISLSGNKEMSKKDSAYDEHKDDPIEWADLMNKWLAVSKKIVSSAWFINVQMLSGNKRDLIKLLQNKVDYLVDIVTWDKGTAQPAMAQGVLDSRFEWVVIFSTAENATRKILLSSWRGQVQNVYEGPPQRSNEFSGIHAATMPVHLPRWIIGTLSDQSQSIYEPFAGTGTTLIAAQELNKRSYNMEISEKYCDVIIKRWEDFTGKTAVKISG